MDVDVHGVVRHLDEQVHLGAALLDRGHAVRVDDRVRDRPILHHAPVDEHVLRPAGRPLLRQRRDVADHLDVAAVPPHVDEIRTIAVELVQAIAERCHRRTLEDGPSGARQREADLRVAERQLRDDPGHLGGLGGVGLQELAARGQVVEHVGHLDRRPLGHARFGDRRDGAAIDADLGARAGAARTRLQPEMRDGGDARQRLAAEAERRDPLEVVGMANLAGRMPLDRQPRVLRPHPLPVVLDTQELLAAHLDRDCDAARAGVDRVLDQLLDDGGGALDDLAGGNLVGEVGGKAMDGAHRCRSADSGQQTAAAGIRSTASAGIRQAWWRSSRA